GGSGERRPGSLEHFEKRVLQPGLLTSADGTFAVRLPYAGSWKVTARSGMLEKSASLTLGPGEEGFCRLELGRLSCRIFGSVVDEKGAPVAASVYARWEGGFLGSTARDGRFELWVNPRPGPCRVQAEHQGRRSAEVSVALGSPAEDHDLGTLVLRPE
ncbi:MAG TPA: carboxypeptidase-like regulatory domain-containing protein, partial [Planctomycetota bacterium]|nr:carboxypeptidase-like regulatory domain-containing protein [Planctomycetota bacterium]